MQPGFDKSGGFYMDKNTYKLHAAITYAATAVIVVQAARIWKLTRRLSDVK